MNTLTESYFPPDTSEPVLDTTVGSVLAAAASKAPDELAMVAWGLEPGDRRPWTFAELLGDAERVACALLRHFEPGERVAVWAHNIPEWVLLEFGAALAGMVLVTVNPAYREHELAYVLRQSRAAGIFHVANVRGNPMAETLAKVSPELPCLREQFDFADWKDFVASGEPRPLPDVSPDDPVQIQYTSGTTGFPKGALLHHRGVTNNARLTMLRMQIQPGDMFVHGVPFFHTGGCVVATLGALQFQGAQAFQAVFNPGQLLEMIERERPSHFGGVPTMLITTLQHPARASTDLSSLRAVLCGGANVPAELVRSIESAFGVRFTTFYGQTETSPTITMIKPDDSEEDKATMTGPPLPQTEVKIVDPSSGETVPPGSVGEICTRGYHVMLGYFEMPEATMETIEADGWLHTGDLGVMDERGYVRVTGRLKEMVIRGGENLFPAEIEAVLHEHDAVADVAVVGVPDPTMGEELVAFVRVVGESAPTREDLHGFVRQRLAAPKTPRYWVFVDEFPMTGSGKVQKFVLRDRWINGEFESDRDSVQREGQQ